MLWSSTKLFGTLINQLRSNVTTIAASPISSRFFHIFQPQTSNSTKITSINNNYISLFNSTFLYPKNLIINQVAGFKVKGRLRRRCKDCMFVMRQQRLHVICKTHPRHKQMSMKAKPDKSWILTHATQSKIRPY